MMGRTLILERHDWETSGSSHQIQIPKAAFVAFFGGRRQVQQVRIFSNPASTTPSNQISVLFSSYTKSATQRINRVMELGLLSHACVLIEEIINDSGTSYDLWWFSDPRATALLANSWNWEQARRSQYGQGRHWIILDHSGPRS
jgi:hypothetical protein